MHVQAEITETLYDLVHLLDKFSKAELIPIDTKDSLRQEQRFISEGLAALEAVKNLHYQRLGRQITQEPSECSRINFLQRKILSLFVPAKQQTVANVRLERRLLRIVLAGETSAGKTAMLNAIFNTNLFFVTQEEATGFMTEIRFDPLLRVEVLDQSGIIKKRLQAKPTWFADHDKTTLKEEYIDVVKDFIAKFTNTSVPDIGWVKKVLVYLPLPLLPRDVVLLDTPGFNASGARSLVAEQALAISHVCLFIIDARNALKNKEMETLKNIRRQVSHVFIILNKMDLILGDNDLDCDGSEAADETITRVKTVLTEHFGSEAVIYPVCSLPREQVHQEARYYVENLTDLFNQVFKQVTVQHTDLLADRLLKDILHLSAFINRLVRQGVKLYEAALRKLQKQTPQPLQHFATDINICIENSIIRCTSIYNKEIARCLEKEKATTEEKYLEWIRGIQDKPALQKDAHLFAEHFLKQSLENISAFRRQSLQTMAKTICEELVDLLEEIYHNFSFKSQFKTTKMIAILINLINLENDGEQSDLEHGLKNIDCRIEQLSAEEVSATPASITVLDSVGLLLGGAIGKYLAGSTLEYTKQKLCQTFLTASTKIWENVSNYCQTDLANNLSTSFIRHLNIAIEQQLVIYEDIIEQGITAYMNALHIREKENADLQQTAASISNTLDILQTMRR